MKRPLVGLILLYTVALLTSIAAMELFSWSLFLLAVAQWSRESVMNRGAIRLPWRQNPNPALLGFLGIVILGAALYAKTSSLMIYSIGNARWILLLWAFAWLLKRHLPAIAEKWIKLFFVVITAAGLYGFFQFLSGIDFIRPNQILNQFGPFYRATGFFNIPLTYGGSMAMASLVPAACLVTGKERLSPQVRHLALLALACGLLGLLASLTRGSWFGFLGGAVGIMLVAASRRQKIIGACALIAAVFLISIIPAIRDSVGPRIQTLFQSYTYAERWELWLANFEMFKDHPLIGVGYTLNWTHLPEIYDRINAHYRFVSHAHNNYVQILGGTGAIGLALYLWICGSFLWMSWRTWSLLPESQIFLRCLALGAFGAQIALHIGGLAECNFFDAEITHLLVFFWAATFAFCPSLKTLHNLA